MSTVPRSSKHPTKKERKEKAFTEFEIKRFHILPPFWSKEEKNLEICFVVLVLDTHRGCTEYISTLPIENFYFLDEQLGAKICQFQKVFFLEMKVQ